MIHPHNENTWYVTAGSEEFGKQKCRDYMDPFDNEKPLHRLHYLDPQIIYFMGRYSRNGNTMVMEMEST